MASVKAMKLYVTFFSISSCLNTTKKKKVCLTLVQRGRSHIHICINASKLINCQIHPWLNKPCLHFLWQF